MRGTAQSPLVLGRHAGARIAEVRAVDSSTVALAAGASHRPSVSQLLEAVPGVWSWLIVAGPQAAWWLFLVASAQYYEEKDGKAYFELKTAHSLAWFDEHLRRHGPLLALALWAARLLPCVLGLAVAAPRLRRLPAWHLTAWAVAGVFYAVVAGLRVGVYKLHIDGHLLHLLKSFIARQLHMMGHDEAVMEKIEKRVFELMSDHIVLGAAIYGILHAELLASFVSLWAARADSARAKGGVVVPALSLLTALHMAACGALMWLVAADMSATARYFHPQSETLASMLVGALLQAPLLLWASA
ncbi:unnamed protein product [Pedinophyceae sp. YPF-701]|nr:unnamed protein product [Pedinophyceae sp. YPF-701]